MISIYRLRSILNIVDGALYWKERPRSEFRLDRTWKMWNTKSAMKKAGTISDEGYVCVKILCDGVPKRFFAHRIVWAIINGEHPKGQIDHINQIKTDNRIDNLRVVSAEDNSRNKPIYSINSSGCSGVSWNNKNKKWVSRIYNKNKEMYLGSFSHIEDAIKARKDMELFLGYHENHGVEKL